MSAKYPNNLEIRQWAEQRKPGVVGPKGAIPRYVIIAWDRAHPGRPYVKSQAYHGTIGGYTSRACRCDECRAAASRYDRETYAYNRDERDEDLADGFA